MQPPDELSRVFAALADPTRRDILSRLGDGPITVGALAANYTMSRPAISQHLGVLENAGLVAQWIAKHRAEWAERFGFLDQHLRSKKGQK
jgi:DNA-binding transcriptional ArsR family regulator